ncbi:MAG: HPP family protein [Rhodocyclaceae bacterium]|nr:HPP family protein [Rhodocyclaceae bacterium]MDZ4215287.1 HPP family protein [Rhodocyclaceae bacterium]
MKISGNWREYLRKWRGANAGSPPRVQRDEIFWSWIGSVLGIGLLAWLGARYFAPYDLSLMIGSFGASAVLLYGAPRSPLAQPRNLIGGHVVSAFIGVVCWQLFHDIPGLAQALAVATAIALMHLTRTLHPPGGATALIATLGVPEIDRLGFWFILMPALLGPLILLVVALLVNNLPRTRRYPEIWF